jgi:amino acid transporter
VDFPGWGTAERLDTLEGGPTAITHLDQTVKHRLGAWGATAICGNDITSSVLYVSALAAAQAGGLAPVVLVIVSIVLYLYRRIYAEVGSALPLNGGTYTVLLNTTSKRVAAAAACLTLLSYIATAVISANEAMHYAHNLLPRLDVAVATVGVLGVFAILNLIGVTESAAVALVIFVVHLATLAMLSVAGSLAVSRAPGLLLSNWRLPAPGGLAHALFFGFAAAMLGISGFESSANFIEEQRPGVFPLTLRNMWAAVALFNPLLSLLSLGLLPLAVIREVPPDLLAQMGTRSLGAWLGWWVSLDAVLVLSGAVLTSYVGVTGLVRRMSLDRCLPQVLLRENRWRETNHWIILGFFALCTSILYVTGGNLVRLAGVYTLSFLSVMALFAIGNMLLKRTRERLPRDTRASWGAVSVALLAVLVGLAGNILLDPGNVGVFAVYFLVALLVVGVMFLRVELLRLILAASRGGGSGARPEHLAARGSRPAHRGDQRAGRRLLHERRRDRDPEPCRALRAPERADEPHDRRPRLRARRRDPAGAGRAARDRGSAVPAAPHRSPARARDIWSGAHRAVGRSPAGAEEPDVHRDAGRSLSASHRGARRGAGHPLGSSASANSADRAGPVDADFADSADGAEGIRPSSAPSRGRVLCERTCMQPPLAKHSRSVKKPFCSGSFHDAASMLRLHPRPPRNPRPSPARTNSVSCVPRIPRISRIPLTGPNESTRRAACAVHASALDCVPSS